MTTAIFQEKSNTYYLSEPIIRRWAFSIYRKNSENFAGNFHRVKNVFHLPQVPFVPKLPSQAPFSRDFGRQNLRYGRE